MTPDEFIEWQKTYTPAVEQSRRFKALVGDCQICDAERVRNREFHPPHDASARCESGKRRHCSCDICF